MLPLALTNFAVYEVEKKRQCALYTVREKNDTNGKPGKGKKNKRGTRREARNVELIFTHAHMEFEYTIIKNCL